MSTHLIYIKAAGEFTVDFDAYESYVHTERWVKNEEKKLKAIFGQDFEFPGFDYSKCRDFEEILIEYSDQALGYVLDNTNIYEDEYKEPAPAVVKLRNKLTFDQIERIRNLCDILSNVELGRKFNVNPSTISRIRNKKSWN